MISSERNGKCARSESHTSAVSRSSGRKCKEPCAVEEIGLIAECAVPKQPKSQQLISESSPEPITRILSGPLCKREGARGALWAQHRYPPSTSRTGLSRGRACGHRCCCRTSWRRRKTGEKKEEEERRNKMNQTERFIGLIRPPSLLLVQ